MPQAKCITGFQRTSGGIIEVIANGACDTSDSFTKSVYVFPAPTATITVNGDTIRHFPKIFQLPNKGVREADISSLPDGMYLVYVTDNKGTLLSVGKLVKSSQ